MSNDNEFPRTTITPNAWHHQSATRTIEVKHLVDKDQARGETYETAIVAAVVEATQSDGRPFSPPVVCFGHNNAQLTRFTRAEWARVKREVDEAFNVFEATWPVGADDVEQPRETGCTCTPNAHGHLSFCPKYKP